MTHTKSERATCLISTTRRCLTARSFTGLSERSYWAKGRPVETVNRSIEHFACVSAFTGPAGKWACAGVTDHATFAWLAEMCSLTNRTAARAWARNSCGNTAHPELQDCGGSCWERRMPHGLLCPVLACAPKKVERFNGNSRAEPCNMRGEI